MLGSTKWILYVHRPAACSCSQCVEICGPHCLLKHQGTAHWISYHISMCVHKNSRLIDQHTMDSFMNSIPEHCYFSVSLSWSTFPGTRILGSGFFWIILFLILPKDSKHLELFCCFFYEIFVFLRQVLKCHVDYFIIRHFADCGLTRHAKNVLVQKAGWCTQHTVVWEICLTPVQVQPILRCRACRSIWHVIDERKIVSRLSWNMSASDPDSSIKSSAREPIESN